MRLKKGFSDWLHGIYSKYFELYNRNIILVKHNIYIIVTCKNDLKFVDRIEEQKQFDDIH